MQMEIILDIPYFPLPPQLVSQIPFKIYVQIFFNFHLFSPFKLLAILCELVFLIYCYYSPYTIILFVFLLSVFSE